MSKNDLVATDSQKNSRRSWSFKVFFIALFSVFGSVAIFSLIKRRGVSIPKIEGSNFSGFSFNANAENASPEVTGSIDTQILKFGEAFSLTFFSRDYFFDPDDNPMDIQLEAVAESLPEWIENKSVWEMKLLSSLDTAGVANNVAIIGDIVYLADSSGLLVVDVGIPANLRILENFDFGGQVYSVAIDTEVLYVGSSSGLDTFDIIDSRKPVLLGSIDTPDIVYRLTVYQGFAYTTGGFTSSAVQIFNVSDSANPIYLGNIDTPTRVYDIVTLNSIAYLLIDDTLQLYDVNNPMNSTLLSSFDARTGSVGLTVSGGMAYISDRNYGLELIDISSALSPTFMGSISLPGGARDAEVKGNIAYVLDFTFGLHLIDIRNPTDLRVLSAIDTLDEPYAVVVKGSVAYVADYRSGLLLIDVGRDTFAQLSGTASSTGRYKLRIMVDDGYGHTAPLFFSLVSTRFPIAARYPILSLMGSLTLISGLFGVLGIGFRYRNKLRVRLRLAQAKLFTSSLHQLSLIPLTEITMGRTLGTGGFGTVYVGKWKRMEVAIKQLHFSGVHSKGLINNFIDEMEVMSSIMHPKVVTIYGLAMGKSGELNLVMEFARGGSLFTHLQQSQPVSDTFQVRIALDIAYGLQYLHAQLPPILHRDIKSENVLLGKGSNDELHAKLTDFGLSKVKAAMQNSPADKGGKEAAGTLPWMAPELFSGKAYTKSADIYSFGMVLWEMVTGKIPFEARVKAMVGLDRAVVKEGFKKLKLSGKKEIIPEDTPKELVTIIRDCWAVKPQKRPSLDNIIARLETFQETLKLGKINTEQPLSKPARPPTKYSHISEQRNRKKGSSSKSLKKKKSPSRVNLLDTKVERISREKNRSVIRPLSESHLEASSSLAESVVKSSPLFNTEKEKKLQKYHLSNARLQGRKDSGKKRHVRSNSRRTDVELSPKNSVRSKALHDSSKTLIGNLESGLLNSAKSLSPRNQR